jgi:iron(III) transport system substrate-binding protein
MRTGRAAGWVAGSILGLTLVAALAGCGTKKPEVVVYTSVDQVYAEPVLRDFEASTGIAVRAVYDVEAAKTTGLAQRLVAEKVRPRADVFWSGEIVQTLKLKKQGVLAPYRSPAAAETSTAADPEGFWTGFGGRGRVFLVARDAYRNLLMGFPPQSISALRLAGDRGALANPVFGTTATHAAVLYSTLGPDKAREFFSQLRTSRLQVLAGNADVRDAVVRGAVDLGLLDTDDAQSALREDAEAVMVVPDQGPDDPGMLVVPNTVALVAGGPNAEAGKRLIDYLLSRETEVRLVRDGWIQVPSHSLSATETTAGVVAGAKVMSVDWEAALGMLERSSADMRELFVR